MINYLRYFALSVVCVLLSSCAEEKLGVLCDDGDKVSIALSDLISQPAGYSGCIVIVKGYLWVEARSSAIFPDKSSAHGYQVDGAVKLDFFSEDIKKYQHLNGKYVELEAMYVAERDGTIDHGWLRDVARINSI